MYTYGAYLEADMSVFGTDYTIVITEMAVVQDEKSLKEELYCQVWSESGFLETSKVKGTSRYLTVENYKFFPRYLKRHW